MNIWKIHKTKMFICFCFIFLPLLIGLLYYVLLAPETIVSKTFSQIFRIDFSFQLTSSFSNLCRNYLSDICWAIALVNALILAIGTTKEQSIISFVVATIFCIFIELAQWFGIINGTFDYWDILIELVSVIISWFITTKIWRSKNEKTS